MLDRMTDRTGEALKTRLHADLTDSMRARDEVRTATLRMALTAVTNEEVAGDTARELSDDDAWRYRAHCAFSHTLPPSPGVTVNTSHAV